jgi:hypothetical protein
MQYHTMTIENALLEAIAASMDQNGLSEDDPFCDF